MNAEIDDKVTLHREYKYLAYALISVVIVFLLSLGYQKVIYPRSIAKKVIDPTVEFRSKYISKAQKIGKSILPVMVSVSNNFESINRKNAERIASVVGGIKSEQSIEIGKMLFARQDTWERLAGAYILSKRNQYPEDLNKDSFLVRQLLSGIVGEKYHGQPRTLAASILGQFHKVDATPFFKMAAEDGNTDYYVCKAVSSLKSEDAFPALLNCLSECSNNCNQIVHTLIQQKPKETISTIIDSFPDKSTNKIGKDLSGIQWSWGSKDALASLEHVTGQSHGRDKIAWQQWWGKAKENWQFDESRLPDIAPKSRRISKPSSTDYLIAILCIGVIYISLILSGYRSSMKISKEMATSQENPPTAVFAGFGPRLSASLLDSLFFMPFVIGFELLARSETEYAYLSIISPLLAPLFFIFFHGKYGATPGKMINKIKLYTLNGTNIGFHRAFLRHALDIVFAVISAVGTYYFIRNVLAIEGTDTYKDFMSISTFEHLKKTLKYDWQKWAEIAALVWVLSELIVLLFNQQRRAIHDFIAGTVVVHTPSEKTIDNSDK